MTQLLNYHKFVIILKIMTGRWDLLPDLIISQIFNYLSRHDRISAGRVVETISDEIQL